MERINCGVSTVSDLLKSSQYRYNSGSEYHHFVSNSSHKSLSFPLQNSYSQGSCVFRTNFHLIAILALVAHPVFPANGIYQALLELAGLLLYTRLEFSNRFW
jgi:hypothetical protein